MKSTQALAFKRESYNFLHQIYKITGTLRKRISDHALKMMHLESMFDIELAKMQRSCFARIKKKKYKNMMLKLQDVGIK